MSSPQIWEERRHKNPTGFLPWEVSDTAVLLVFSARVPHHTWFTYNLLTDWETNTSRCSRITKEGSILHCQSLHFISDWLGGIKSCLPRVKPVNKTTLLKKTPQPQDASDCYETAARKDIWEIIELFLSATKPEPWQDGQKMLPKVICNLKRCFPLQDEKGKWCWRERRKIAGENVPSPLNFGYSFTISRTVRCWLRKD